LFMILTTIARCEADTPNQTVIRHLRVDRRMANVVGILHTDFLILVLLTLYSS
jgi:hypothetical protein